MSISHATPAAAYEYALQFTPNPGARGLMVAGYAFAGDTVTGNCSYYIVSGGSGRGGGYRSHTTYFDHACTWDLHGNLLKTVPGMPAAPSPLASANGLLTYARSALGDTTGRDTAHAIGFVDTSSPQYAWVTQPSFVYPPSQAPFAVTLVLQSQGDSPLIVGAIDATAMLARAKVQSNTCQQAPVPPGRSCSITIVYDPSGLPPRDDPYTAFDRLTVGIVSNSGQAPDFAEPVDVNVTPGN